MCVRIFNFFFLSLCGWMFRSQFPTRHWLSGELQQTTWGICGRIFSGEVNWFYTAEEKWVGDSLKRVRLCLTVLESECWADSLKPSSDMLNVLLRNMSQKLNRAVLMCFKSLFDSLNVHSVASRVQHIVKEIKTEQISDNLSIHADIKSCDYIV